MISFDRLKPLLLLLPVLLLSGCYWSDHEGYSRNFSGLHYQFHYLGDGEQEPQKGDYFQYRITLTTLNDSVLYHNHNSATGGPKWQVFNPTTEGGLYEGVGMMRQGDSATFIVERSSFALEAHKLVEYVPQQAEKVKAKVKLTHHKTPEEYAQLQERLSWKEDEEMNEQIRLNNFLKENNISDDEYLDGIYFIRHKKGNGPKAVSGKTLRIHYRAGFLNGKVLDETYMWNHPLEVRLGDPEQLLEGFEIGIRQMRQGGHATFIIPSLLAYGHEGSSNGAVKPYQTLIYEVELVDVE